MNPIVFGILAALLVAAALGVVVQRSPVRSALSLVSALFTMAVMFLLLNAQLVAALQFIVYAGAIVVLFLFVIMLLNLQHEPQAIARLGRTLAAVLIGSLFLLAAIRFFRVPPAASAGTGMGSAVAASFGTTQALSQRLFTQFLLPFEITSVLLLVAIIGAVVLAKRNVT